jgi:taurine dioxygenase
MNIELVTPAIGAEISGLDLNNLTLAQYDDIYDALIAHKVIFFRDQDLTPRGHLDFASSFGEPEPPHPIYPNVEGYERITLLKTGPKSKPDANDWHKDMTFRAEPPFTSILHAVNVPATGGDTLWANTNSAYNALPKMWQDYLADKEAIHDIGTFRNDLYARGGIEAVNDGLKSTGSAVHKIVGTHPVTGLKYLNINQSFTRHIIGEVQGESDRILQFLYLHMAKPEFQVRLRWRKNTVAMWDNRITHHYAISDYLPNERHMQRVTVIRDKREPKP